MPTLRRSCPRVARIIPNPRPGSQPEPRQPGRLSESSRIERQGRPTLPAACRSRASRQPSRQFCIPPPSPPPPHSRRPTSSIPPPSVLPPHPAVSLHRADRRPPADNPLTRETQSPVSRAALHPFPLSHSPYWLRGSVCQRRVSRASRAYMNRHCAYAPRVSFLQARASPRAATVLPLAHACAWIIRLSRITYTHAHENVRG